MTSAIGSNKLAGSWFLFRIIAGTHSHNKCLSAYTYCWNGHCHSYRCI